MSPAPERGREQTRRGAPSCVNITEMICSLDQQGNVTAIDRRSSETSLMSFSDATVTAAPKSLPLPPRVTSIVRFLGGARGFWRLLSWGAVLLMFTLGIYRFWLTTDIRRFLWSNTELAGESFEYTGTAGELLLGFLVAIAILAPINVVFFLFTFSAGAAGQVAGLLAPVLLLLLSHYAIYRARRYRLTRTIYRGVRFHQNGSAWRYAVCAALWWSLTVLTLGLAYPFAQSSLERFKMRHTYFGDLQGRFEGSAGQLLLRGLLLWALAVIPLVIGVVATLAVIDWNALLGSASADDPASSLEASGLASAVVLASLTGLWLVLAFAILYPIFQALVLRWWAGGLRFGELGVTSRLRATQVLRIYGRFIWIALSFTLVAGALVLAGWIVIDKLIGPGGQPDSLRNEIITTGAALGAYVAIALGYSTIYQATVKLGLWRSVVESLDISHLATLDNVSAAGEPASPIGEGLADALNVAGI
jgi:uncharacterized membrane protein YjgN (DUF898 family)